MFGRNPPLILKQEFQMNDTNPCYDLGSNNKIYFKPDKIFIKYGELIYHVVTELNKVTL